MPATDLRLLSLDGGGVRGLSALMILRHLMTAVNPDAPPKPCDYFDMIGGTSTGGLIAIMLGRLRMTVDECIDAYTKLSDKVFEKSHRVNIRGHPQWRFDSAELERAVKAILVKHGLAEDTLLKDLDSPCKVFVCATSKETSDTVCLTTYRSPRGYNPDLLDGTTIWQACRATSAATTFFDPIAIGPFGEEFVDGALGANNPVQVLWNQALDLWGPDDQLRAGLRCLVSIGTGVPALKPVGDDVLSIWPTLKAIATETERTAEKFHRDKTYLDNEGRYYRFNVDRGLEGVGLQESGKKKEIAAATRRYVELEAVNKLMRACADGIAGRKYCGPYRTAFSLQGVPVSEKFVPRPSAVETLEKHLSPRHHSQNTRRRVFVLHGLGGIGKTQLAVDFARRHKTAFSSIFWLNGVSEDRLKQSLASCASRIPQGQIPERSRDATLRGKQNLDVVVADVLEWLARPDNVDWLLIFDNVDQDVEQGGETGAYDVTRYFPGDHGSVLITTRLFRLAQLGEAQKVTTVDKELSKAIFERWRGRGLVMDEAGKELLTLLDGLPLALAQAASYLRETETDVSTYVRLYKQQWDDLMSSDSEKESPLVDYEQRSIGTTWTMSFKAIEAQNGNAAELLRLWAFLDNKDFWYGLLHEAISRRLLDEETLGVRDWPEWILEIGSDEVKFKGAARLLVRYSMIEAQDSVPGSYTMHPVVHRWTSHIQNSEEKRKHARVAVMVIGISVPYSTTENYWVLQQRLLAHAERCWWWMGQVCTDELDPDTELTLAIYMLGYFYSDQDQLQISATIFQRVLQNCEKILRPDHTLTLKTLTILGLVYARQGRLQEAEAIYQRAVQICEKVLGPYRLQTLETLVVMSLLYMQQGRLQEAELILQRALQSCEKVLGPDHLQTLETLVVMSLLYMQQDRLQEAELILQRALQSCEKVFGPNHLQTLKTLASLGFLYRSQHRLQEAEAIYQRAFSGFQTTLGPSHPRSEAALQNLLRLQDARSRALPEVMLELPSMDKSPPQATRRIFFEKMRAKVRRVL